MIVCVKDRHKLKIGQLVNMINVVVINDNNFAYDLLIGLDTIELFKLKQNEFLNIEQIYKNKTIEIEKSSQNWSQNTVNYLVNKFEAEEIYDQLNQLSHLDKEDSDNVIKLLLNNRDLFAPDKYDVSTTSMARAEIKLIKNEVVALRPYNCTLPDYIEMEKQIDNLLKRKLIEPSTSPYAAPVVVEECISEYNNTPHESTGFTPRYLLLG